jgi:hypothetical protein
VFIILTIIQHYRFNKHRYRKWNWNNNLLLLFKENRMDKVGKIKRFKLVEIQPNKFKRKTRHHQYKRIILINWINLNIKVILLNNKSPINYHIISKTKENMELKYLKTNKFK